MELAYNDSVLDKVELLQMKTTQRSTKMGRALRPGQCGAIVSITVCIHDLTYLYEMTEAYDHSSRFSPRGKRALDRLILHPAASGNGLILFSHSLSRGSC